MGLVSTSELPLTQMQRSRPGRRGPHESLPLAHTALLDGPTSYLKRCPQRMPRCEAERRRSGPHPQAQACNTLLKPAVHRTAATLPALVLPLQPSALAKQAVTQACGPGAAAAAPRPDPLQALRRSKKMAQAQQVNSQAPHCHRRRANGNMPACACLHAFPWR